MYQNNRRGGYNSSRGGNRSNNNFSRGRGRGNGRGKKSSINPQMLIKKAIIKEAEADHHIPAFEYKDLNIDPQLKSNVLAKGFSTPTPIQERAIPLILEGKDIVGIANTGTGKTAAFLIPVIQNTIKNRDNRTLIIAPTRELAEQIEHDAYNLTKDLKMRSLLIVGGASMNMQIGKLRSNPHILVGTPGRLLDLIERRVLNLGYFQTIILDEVDRMLDMGFVHDVKEIISKLPANRQSLFFSATMTHEVENILDIFSKTYEKISVKTAESSDNIHQDIIEVRSGEEKYTKLAELLKDENFKKVIIFARTKRGVKKLDERLYEQGFKVESLHGNKTQPQRKRALDSFRNNRANILVATDVAARGLDVKNVSHVINYDMPETYQDYVHRIGRTGRASQIGNALTFVEK